LLSVEELLYGMMLPSGNDAAQSLALYFGCLLQSKCPLSYLESIEDKLIDAKMCENQQQTL
jgi:hypothetical protein